MTTKEQERKALEQIKNIIASLGPNSYIAIAMDGMIEDAEENIKNDFALSMKDRWQTAEQACDLRRDEVFKLREEKKLIQKELDLAKFTLQQESERRQKLAEDFDQVRIEKFEAENRAGCAESKIVEMKDEIVHLKAKLYDMMVK